MHGFVRLGQSGLHWPNVTEARSNLGQHFAIYCHSPGVRGKDGEMQSAGDAWRLLLQDGLLARHLGMQQLQVVGVLSPRFRSWRDTGAPLAWQGALAAALPDAEDRGERGDRRDCRDRRRQTEFLKDAVRFMSHTSPARLQALLGGAWPRLAEVTGPDGGRCLHATARWGTPEVAAALLESAREAGVLAQVLEQRCDDLSTCLHYAAESNTPEVLRVLLGAGERAGVLDRLLTVDNGDRRTCLDVAVALRRVDVVRVITELPRVFDGGARYCDLEKLMELLGGGDGRQVSVERCRSYGL